MADPDFLDRAVAAFTAAVALDRYRIGAWLRERGRGDIARAVEHGDHLDDDQPAIPSLRLVMAARDHAQQRADAAEAEVERLKVEAAGVAYFRCWPDGFLEALGADSTRTVEDLAARVQGLLAAEAEVKRLRDLVREAYIEGWHDAPYAGDDDDVNNFWQKSDALADLDKPR